MTAAQGGAGLQLHISLLKLSGKAVGQETPQRASQVVVQGKPLSALKRLSECGPSQAWEKDWARGCLEFSFKSPSSSLGGSSLRAGIGFSFFFLSYSFNT